MAIKILYGLGLQSPISDNTTNLSTPMVSENGTNSNTIPPENIIIAAQHQDVFTDTPTAPYRDIDINDQSPLGIVPTFSDPPPAPPASLPPPAPTTVVSSISMPAVYETLFHDYDLEAIPVYNFWTEDEETNDRDLRGDRDLSDIPRFIRLIWNTAPDLPVTEKTSISDVKNQSDRSPARIGTEIDVAPNYTSNGIVFSPEHMRNFDLATNSLANGHVSPGVIETLVEVNHAQLANEPLRTAQCQLIDEMAFLSHPDTDGVSINELISNINNISNGTLGGARISDDDISQELMLEKSSNFDGKFSIERPLGDSAFLNIKAIASASPALSYKTRVSDISETQLSDHVITLAEKITLGENSVPDTETIIKVKFQDPAIDGIVNADKIDAMSHPEHAENAIGIGQFLPNLNVVSFSNVLARKREITIPSFPSPALLKRAEYVGYVIEKYSKDSSGFFKLVEEIKLGSREYDEYIDTRIVYGGTYRYRIHGVIRWTRDPDVGVEGVVPFSQITGRGDPAASKVSSYFATEWDRTWSYATVLDMEPPAPPDEMTVRPMSYLKRIVITAKMPFNPQLDISALRIFRKTQDASGRDLEAWSQVGPDFGPGNILFNDDDVKFSQENGDVRYVYATVCLSRHAEMSTLSDQISARLNSDFSLTGEYPVDFVSQSGVKLEHHGYFNTIPFKRFKSQIVTKRPIVFSGRDGSSQMMFKDSFFIARVQSLDTGETFDYPLSVKYRDMKTRVVTSNSNVTLGRQASTSGRVDVSVSIAGDPGTIDRPR